MIINGQFDATQTPPSQGGGKVMPGIWDATISNTYGKPNSAGDGGMLCVDFTTADGMITNRYNIWNKSDKAREIAFKELSALAHAVGIYRFTANDSDLPNAGRELRNAKCKISVGWQAGQEPSTEKPEGGYTEIKKVLDINGNEPGKGPAQQAQPQQGGFGQPQGQAPQQPNQPSQPITQQANGAWGGNGSQPQQAAQQPPQGQPQQQTGQPWSPGGAGAASQAPPWGSRS